MTPESIDNDNPLLDGDAIKLKQDNVLSSGQLPDNSDKIIHNNEQSISRDIVEKQEDNIIYEDGYQRNAFNFFKILIYDIISWILTSMTDGFFREIRSRGAYKIPLQGPVIFVAAPHANQFVDPVILMRQIKAATNKRVSFLTAQKSLDKIYIGPLARCVRSIGVTRQQDNLVPAKGWVKIDPDDPRKLIGKGTNFTSFDTKGLIGLSNGLGTSNILSIQSDTELTLRKEFKIEKPEVRKVLINGTKFKYAPKCDQSSMYHKVFEHLAHNGSIGIFPEGGSHDRTDLLPLKAGVAIMALGCLDKFPNCNVKIVPCGMNYFHAHKFRSRAVIEFGDPIEIPHTLVEKYRNSDTNKAAVKELLNTVQESLRAVTVTCQDYETLMVVQATRRLYSAQLPSKLPLPMVIEMNRRIVKGFEKRKNDPEIIQLKNDILKYNAKLKHYNVPDHLVDVAQINFIKNSFLLFCRSFKLLIASILALPGVIMFSPVFIAAKRISQQKAKQALANSTVKINANDVVATWKILMAMGIAPILYIFWSSVLTYYLSNWFKHKILIFCMSFVFCCSVTYSALLIGDIGMDIFKSLKPLIFSMTTPSALKILKKQRKSLSERITLIVNSFEDGMFGETEDEYQASDIDESMEERKTTELKRRRLLKKRKLKKIQKQIKISAKLEPVISESDAISLVNSDNSLSNIPLFSISNNNLDSVTSNFSSSVSEFEVEKPKKENSLLADKIAQAVWNKREN